MFVANSTCVRSEDTKYVPVDSVVCNSNVLSSVNYYYTIVRCKKKLAAIFDQNSLIAINRKHLIKLFMRYK